MIPEGFKHCHHHYYVNRRGDVWSIKKQGLITQRKTPKDYWQVVVQEPGKQTARGRKNLRIHTLVMQTWGPPKPVWADQIRHLDGNKDNNHITNLAWGDNALNYQDYVKHHGPRGKTHCLRGHPKTPENTGTDSRCLPCRRWKWKNRPR